MGESLLLPTGETVGRIVPEECIVLSSAAKPLLLSFEVPEEAKIFLSTWFGAPFKLGVKFLIKMGSRLGSNSGSEF